MSRRPAAGCVLAFDDEGETANALAVDAALDNVELIYAQE